MQPKLRAVEAHLVQHGGQPAILLRDPLRLSDQAVLLPPQLAPLLELCDGTRDESELRAALAVRAGLRLSPAVLEQILAQLDDALLLDNERFAQAYTAALQEFQAAPWRPPGLAGINYPADPDALKDTLQGYIDSAPNTGQQTDGRPIRGLVSPHIDYRRGGPVYAQVWDRVAEAVREAEIVIIFGTDHLSEEEGLTLTRQHYATPWGVLPTAHHVVEAVAQAIGDEAAFRDELHHCVEHSIELAAVWLHYLTKEKGDGTDRPCQLVPILCGPFQRFVTGDDRPGQDAALSAAIEALRAATTSSRTIVVAAADLAHVGPAFGDSYPIDFVGRARLTAADQQLMATLCTGDAEAFFQGVKEEQDRRRICGLPPIYLTLRYLDGAKGEVSGYRQCPADQRGTSLVSICGIVFR
ncbi:MAG TPA: AmmeMemoRadiSam system protein B [Anaerolineae bacterium]|nr:AmmeMemoRadiSam system protein B [Anaerolineae bacterium]